MAQSFVTLGTPFARSSSVVRASKVEPKPVTSSPSSFPLKPLFKIAGGKRDLAPQICDLLPSKIDHYYEPFCGGAAVALELLNRGQAGKIYLNDINDGVIKIYEDVKRSPGTLHSWLDVSRYHYYEDPKSVYYHYRSEWNAGVKSSSAHLLLRAACFNGLWRENKKGKMNSPWGKRTRLSLPSRDDLESMSKAFEQVELMSADFCEVFDDLLNRPESDLFTGTAIYCDPPYHNTFSSYHASGFGEKDQEDLIRGLAELDSRSVFCVYSNSDSDLIHDLLSRYWPDASIKKVLTKRRISCKGERRGPVSELLVSSSR